MPEALWFLNTRVTIHVGHAEGSDGISVLEHHAPAGDSPPMHLHQREDEIFHVLSGELRLVIGDREARAGAGESVLAPRGVPHTDRVESAGGARWLTVTARGDFERFVRALGRPATRDGLPEPAGPPAEAELQALGATCAAHGIELVGPPLG